MRPKDFSELPDLELGEREGLRSAITAIEQLRLAAQKASKAMTAATERLLKARAEYQQAMEELTAEIERVHPSLGKDARKGQRADIVGGRDLRVDPVTRPPHGTGTRRSG